MPSRLGSLDFVLSGNQRFEIRLCVF
uniref:Uncharacterized protein n=1 Tax=Anguilla anguilla TaxID=7936 RepID=A0A0E9T1V0_ANGAN